MVGTALHDKSEAAAQTRGFLRGVLSTSSRRNRKPWIQVGLRGRARQVELLVTQVRNELVNGLTEAVRVKTESILKSLLAQARNPSSRKYKVG